MRFKDPIAVLLLVLASNCQAATIAEFFSIGSSIDSGDFTAANAVDAIGSTVVGQGGPDLTHQAFRWTEDDGLQPISVLSPNAVNASDISDDGTTIVGGADRGDGHNDEPYRWSGDTGIELLNDLSTGESRRAIASGVSGDGSAIVGTLVDSGEQAYFWNEESGFVELGFLPDFTRTSQATAISSDSSTIVGRSTSLTASQAYRWTEATGMLGIGSLSELFVDSSASDVSDNGEVIVGFSLTDSQGFQAFRWTVETGMIGLGNILGSEGFSAANGVTADGSIIVGTGGENRDTAFVWDACRGMQNLQEFLSSEFGLSDVLSGWKLTRANDISADGRVIVGTGRNPDGVNQAWSVRFDAPITVPEPSSTTLTLAVAALFVVVRRYLEGARHAGSSAFLPLVSTTCRNR